MFAVAVSQMWWLMRGKASYTKELKELSALVIKAVIRRLKFYSRLLWQGQPRYEVCCGQPNRSFALLPPHYERTRTYSPLVITQ